MGFLERLIRAIVELFRTSRPSPVPDRTAEYEEVCRRVWREELDRPLGSEFEPGDEATLSTCVARQRDGVTEEQLRVEVRESDYYKNKHRPAPPPVPHLHTDGRQLRVGDQVFVWRGVTAFRLLDYLADGQPEMSVAFLDWAAQSGFNVVRVLATAQYLFDLKPADGVRALPWLLDLANARGLYVEVVCLADTNALGMGLHEIGAHVSSIGTVVTDYSNALVELANENCHFQHPPVLQDVPTLNRLRELIPFYIPVSLGSSACGLPEGIEHYKGGDYLTVHLDRGLGDSGQPQRGVWNMVRRVRHLEEASHASGKFVVNDEPIGAGEESRSGRLQDPNVFFGFGVLGRIFECGSTFHYQDGLQALPPKVGTVQKACAQAFIEGTKIVPDDTRLAFKNAGWIDSPIRGFNDNNSVRIYSGINGDRGIAAALGVTGDLGIEWRDPWRSAGVLEDRPGIQVLNITRS